MDSERLLGGTRRQTVPQEVEMTGRPFIALALMLFAATTFAAPPDTPETRLEAANQLFALPAYRLIASRQISEAIKFLPEGQYRSAVAALSNPRVMRALRETIVRSMAQTYTTAELSFLGGFFASEEARAFVEKLDTFEANLTREVMTAVLTNPDLADILLGQ